MIHSLKIIGYRALRDFSMEGLSRINLLVGKNNTGKSSVLEALYLLSTGGEPSAIWRVLMRRGEQISDNPMPGRPFQPEIEPRHLFYGHDIRIGNLLSITTFNGAPDRAISFEISEADRETTLALFAQFGNDPEGTLAPRFAMNVKGIPTPPVAVIPLTARGGLRQDVMQALINRAASTSPPAESAGHQYITTESLAIGELQAAFNQISLSPREERVIRALQFIEPDIERIAMAPGVFFGGPGWPTRGGLKVKLKGIDEPVPIGSLGEGMWRMLSLAISLARSGNSVFLIDEIDTGLHFSVMTKLWRFVVDVAREFNVQIFATTHSLDCVRSLAAICDEDRETATETSIQRLEPNKNRAVSYVPDEVVALAQSSKADEEIEVR
jgi:AAA domain, putative AbiEii toxin, Type IV TA system/AAA ATPase domain